MNNHTLSLSQVEHFLSVQSRFCLIDWLLKENILAYGQYEAWRHGKERFLDTSCTMNDKEIDALINETQNACGQLGLSCQEQEYYAWDESIRNALKASKRPKVHAALTLQWLRPQDVPQMDLFMDNSGVIAENDTLDALSGRKFDAAQEHLRRLTELNPSHEKLGAYQDLINYGQHMRIEHIEEVHLLAELEALENEVLPLARETLTHNARDYLACAWRRLSGNLTGKQFDPTHPKTHDSYVLMQIPDWAAALESLKRENNLYSIPELLHRLAMCYETLKCNNEALYTWCLLMELDGPYCEAAIENKTSTIAWDHWQDFWEMNDAGLTSFFPAFILAKRPGLIHHIDTFPSLKESSSLAVLGAINARLKKSDEISERKKMQDISPALLRLYLNAR